LKKTEAELLGLLLDLERVPEERKEEIREKIKVKEKEIEWIKENLWRYPKPYVI